LILLCSNARSAVHVFMREAGEAFELFFAVFAEESHQKKKPQ
jgi:hypothetical protein